MEEADAPPHEEVACARPWVAQQASHLPGEAACVLLAEAVAPHVEVACVRPWVAQQASRLPAEAACVLLAEVVAPHVEVACAWPWVAQQVSRLPAEAVCARPGEASLLPPGALDDPQHLEVASLQRLSGLVWPWRLSEAV